MSSLAVKRQEREMPTVESVSPIRAMRRLLGWDPFREMAPYLAMGEAGLAFMPAFEIKETKDAYEFRADIPGVKESDIEITVTGNRLTISGTREAEAEDKTDRYFATERVYGSFVRSFTLPEDVDPNTVRATLANGVLSVTVPKKPETQPRRIAVGSQAQPAGKPQQPAQAQEPPQPSGQPRPPQESSTQIKQGQSK